MRKGMLIARKEGAKLPQFPSLIKVSKQLSMV